jgi:outer membrane protein OmpA-like peptidoglycan-associated protein
MLNNTTYNAGKSINTKYWESQGCFSPDGKYLYFVSNRPGGFGGKDIWRSEITQKGFLPAVNLGDTINTKYDEMSPFVHPDNLTFYFSSDGQTGFGDYDLFVSRRSNTAQEWELPKNMGFPINTHNTENSLIVAANGKTAYYASDASGFGKEDIFQFELPENLQAEPLAELEMDIITQKAGEEVILKNVSFASNSYALEQSSFAELDKLIAYLKKNPNLQIEIQGHTDDIGSEIDNLILSQERAKVVFEYLSAKLNNKLTYKGFGESQPLGLDKEKNRRTSFVIFQ